MRGAMAIKKKCTKAEIQIALKPVKNGANLHPITYYIEVLSFTYKTSKSPPK